MRRMPLVLSAVLLAPLAFAAPAAAQDTAEPKVNQLIVYGDDQCPESGPDTITVCARKDESERFRIPALLRESASPANEAWTSKVVAYETVGRAGTMSCSPVGAGGWTGCSGKLIDAAYAEKKNAADVKFGDLIAAERAKRLSTVDAEAAETQARVEALEKQIEEREKAREAGASGESGVKNTAPTGP